MKNYKLVIISLLLLVFMVGAVSAADENVTDDNLEISDEISVDEEAVASSDVDEIGEDDILQQETDLQDTLGARVLPTIVFPDNPDGETFKVFDGSSKEFYGQFINLYDEEPIVDTNVNIVVLDDDEEVYAEFDVETDSEGYGRFTVDFPIGTAGNYYTINSLRNGDPFEIVGIMVYDSSAPSYINILKERISKDNYAAIAGENLILNIYINDGKDDAVPNSTVIYSVGNISDVVKAEEGVYDLVINSLPVGQYNLSVYCPEINVTKTVGIYVFSEPLPTVIADNFTMIYGDNKEFTVKLTDECGLPLNGYCMIKIGNLQISQRADENGTVNFVFDTLEAGASYTAQITNSWQQKSIYRTITVLHNSSITAEDNATFNCEEDENSYIMSFTNINGTPLVNGTVDVIIDDNENYHYVLTTDENGNVSVDLSNLPGGNHIITIVNPITGEKTSTTVNLIKGKSSISTSAVTTVYNGGKYVVFTLKNSKGVALSGKSVSVVLNGKTFKGTTDKNGQFKVSTDGLAPKAYTATMTFAEDDYLIGSTATAKITVNKATPKLTAKKATFKTKTKKYTITLKDNKNKAMKKVKVTLKVKGKTYKATTNAKGKATFKLTKLTKKGKYTAKVKFAGNKNFKAVTKSVKLTVKK